MGLSFKQFNDGGTLLNDVKNIKDNIPQSLTEEQINKTIEAYEVDFNGIQLTDELKNLIYYFRKPEKTYALGDIVYVNTLPLAKKLVCVGAGTSSKNNIIFTSMDEGTLVIDGTVTWIIDSLADGIYNAGHQNSKYREVDITNYWESGLMSTNIQAGKFISIYPGDYIVKSVTINGTTYNNVEWIVGDCDYYLNGYQNDNRHHVLMFPRNCLGITRMNSTDTTSGGYTNSEMWKTTIPKYVTGIQNAFGTSHIRQFQSSHSTAVNTNAAVGAYSVIKGASSSQAWVQVYVDLFTENMVYGANFGTSSIYDADYNSNQVSAFMHNSSLRIAYNPIIYWLRNVANTTGYCWFNAGLPAAFMNASNNTQLGVRPYFLLV